MPVRRQLVEAGLDDNLRLIEVKDRNVTPRSATCRAAVAVGGERAGCMVGSVVDGSIRAAALCT